ncbi:MAG: glycosyltransferase family 4 protein, partial [Patescibacteria group bacterium]
MNVLHIVDKYGFGGVESIVDSLIKNFNIPNIQLTYYFIRKPVDKPVIQKNNVIVKNYSKFNLFPLIDIFFIIKNKKIDIIHTHHRKGFYFGIILSLIFRDLKFIHHEHGDILINNRLYNNLFKICKKRINGVICVSDYIRDFLLKNISIKKDKLYVLNNFVRCSASSDIINIDFYPKDNYTIGFIGRLSEVKGCKFLIESLSFLPTNYKAIIAGDGPELLNLKTLSRDLDLDSRIKFLGFVSDVEHVYNEIDLLVISSLSEANPIVLNESWMFGVPVIVSDIESLASLVQDKRNVLTFQSKNSADLANKIKYLLSDGELYLKLIHNGKDNVKGKDLNNYITSLA